jgi:hypothetical protein
MQCLVQLKATFAPFGMTRRKHQVANNTQCIGLQVKAIHLAEV